MLIIYVVTYTLLALIEKFAFSKNSGKGLLYP